MEVEEVKMVLQLIPIWSTCILFWTIYSQMNTFTIEQATFMKRNIGSFEIPAGSFSVFLFLTILLFTSLNERLIVPSSPHFVFIFSKGEAFFFASVRLEIRPTGKIKSVKGDEDIGVKVRVRVQKSKVSRPYKQAEFEIIFGEGVGQLGCILDCAEMMDVVLKKGSWYSYADQRCPMKDALQN